jgi:uncharacterized protein YecT (DUF1311 family)
MKKVVSLFLCFTWAVVCGQETEKKHPIDANLENCLAKEMNYTTAGMLDCTQKAYNEWDNELNSVYKKLMLKLSDNEKSTLKKSQVEWIMFRDLEFKNIDSIYDKLEGTMYIPMKLNEKMEIVRRRTLQLDGYLLLLN